MSAISDVMLIVTELISDHSGLNPKQVEENFYSESQGRNTQLQCSLHWLFQLVLASVSEGIMWSQHRAASESVLAKVQRGQSQN